MHLTEHRDFAALALRLCVYEIRRFAARMSRRRHRTFLVLDESWALLDTRASGGVASTAGPFLSSSVRMGRKEGMSVIGLSQVIEDFVRSPYGAAIVGNSSTKLVGQPGGESVEGLRAHLQADGPPGRAGSPAVADVPRITSSCSSKATAATSSACPRTRSARWVFTTSPKDRERFIAARRGAARAVAARPGANACG